MKNLASAYKQDILILNNTYFSKSDSFYFELFRIPEVLNRLKQYKEILNENDMNIPFWVYNLTENFKIYTEGGNQRYLVHFLISLGFFDRYISKNGWPKYIIGRDPLISVVLGETSFEEQVLLLTKGYCQESQGLQLYETSSYYNTSTGSFHLTQLKRKEALPDIKSILCYIKREIDSGWDSSFQLLSPHAEGFMEDLKNQGIFPKDFLEFDSSLKWLWPLWKKNQIKNLKKFSRETSKERQRF